MDQHIGACYQDERPSNEVPSINGGDIFRKKHRVVQKNKVGDLIHDLELQDLAVLKRLLTDQETQVYHCS